MKTSSDRFLRTRPATIYSLAAIEACTRNQAAHILRLFFSS